MTKLDVHVKTPTPGRTSEVFVVTVEYSVGTAVTSSSLSLVGYFRLTSYGEHVACADRGVDVRLCICQAPTLTSPVAITSSGFGIGQDASSGLSFAASRELLHYPPVVFGRKTSVHAVDASTDQPCIYVLSRKYDVGAVFELVNVCDAKTFSVTFRLTGVNIDVSSAMPATTRLHPGHRRFLSTVRQSVAHLSWNWSYAVNYSVVRTVTVSDDSIT